MNKSILVGRLTRDPEMRITPNQVPVCTFTLAVDRRFKDAAGNRQADFIPIVAWRQAAEFANKYFRKGSRMVVVGSIQTRNWEDESGTRHYVTEVIAEEIEFGESKQQQSPPLPEAPYQPEAAGNYPDPDQDTSLPFEL